MVFVGRWAGSTGLTSLEIQYTEEKDLTQDLSTDMTRQYKAMQARMQGRIDELEADNEKLQEGVCRHP